MATAQIIFQRFFYAKSLVKFNFYVSYVVTNCWYNGILCFVLHYLVYHDGKFVFSCKNRRM